MKTAIKFFINTIFLFSSGICLNAQNVDDYLKKGNDCYAKFTKNNKDKNAIECAKENYAAYIESYKDNPARVPQYVFDNLNKLEKDKTGNTKPKPPQIDNTTQNTTTNEKSDTVKFFIYRGTVKNEITGEPINGAKLTFQGFTDVVLPEYTDSEGTFIIGLSKKYPNVKIRVTKTNYNPKELNINLSEKDFSRPDLFYLTPHIANNTENETIPPIFEPQNTITGAKPSHSDKSIIPYLPFGLPQIVWYNKPWKGTGFLLLEFGFIGGAVYSFSESSKYKRWAGTEQNDNQISVWERKSNCAFWLGGVGCLAGFLGTYAINIYHSKKDCKANLTVTPFSSVESSGLTFKINF